MPTIQSKKYEDHVHYITVEDWQTMKDKGFDRRFKVIDDSDIQDTVIETPQAFEPLHTLQMEEPDATIHSIDFMTKEVIKTWLSEHDIEYDSKAKKEEIYQLYLDNQ